MTMTYDRDAAIRAGEAAQDAVEAGTDDEWLRTARMAVRRTAVHRHEFTADDVWQLNELAGTRENRAMGPVMVWAKNKGLIEATDRFAVGRNVKHHGANKRIWRSKVFGGPA